MTANESCHIAGGFDDHYNHAMFVMGVWQTVIAALAFLATIAFGIFNGGYLRASCALHSCPVHVLTTTTGHERE